MARPCFTARCHSVGADADSRILGLLTQKALISASERAFFDILGQGALSSCAQNWNLPIFLIFVKLHSRPFGGTPKSSAKVLQKNVSQGGVLTAATEAAMLAISQRAANKKDNESWTEFSSLLCTSLWADKKRTESINTSGGKCVFLTKNVPPRRTPLKTLSQLNWASQRTFESQPSSHLLAYIKKLPWNHLCSFEKPDMHPPRAVFCYCPPSCLFPHITPGFWMAAWSEPTYPFARLLALFAISTVSSSPSLSLPLMLPECRYY